MQYTGKDLIAMGYNPGKWFRTALDFIAQHPSMEIDDLKVQLDQMAPKLIPMHALPIAYHKNIEATSELEQINVASVCKSMDAVMKTPTVVTGAIMPDACPTGGDQIPVGGVIKTYDAIHPAMHSADICCSVMYTNLGDIDPKTLMDQAFNTTHFGGGGRFDQWQLDQELKAKLKANPFTSSDKAIQLAHQNLGTQGDGNHFLYIGNSEQTGDTVMVTHHGSRGLGAYLYKEGMKAAKEYRREFSPETPAINAWIPYSTDEGKSYWEALQLIREWTKLNHSLIHKMTYEALGLTPKLQFWNEHNFVFKDGDHFLHAKGATPLVDRFVPDSHEGLRIIPLNMGQPILIVKGDETENNLGFAPHGAGRNMSRTQHIRNQVKKTNQEIFDAETAGLDVRFYSGVVDISELPSAYKDADEVQRQMKVFGLGQVVDRILPYGSIMAGDRIANAPWKNKKRRK
jgi:tRNA-splicing ligase RtcB (3'-phosphate/5'-hydroxy nucleic acid ligase)